LHGKLVFIDPTAYASAIGGNEADGVGRNKYAVFRHQAARFLPKSCVFTLDGPFGLTEFEYRLKKYESGLKKHEYRLTEFEYGLKKCESRLKKLESGLRRDEYRLKTCEYRLTNFECGLNEL
jgi:hypothetical protein